MQTVIMLETFLKLILRNHTHIHTRSHKYKICNADTVRCFVLVLHLRNRGMCAALEGSSEIPYIMRLGGKNK